MNGQSSVSNPLNACISCMRAAGVKPGGYTKGSKTFDALVLATTRTAG
jgi:hypothetical protein